MILINPSSWACECELPQAKSTGVFRLSGAKLSGVVIGLMEWQHLFRVYRFSPDVLRLEAPPCSSESRLSIAMRRLDSTGLGCTCFEGLPQFRHSITTVRKRKSMTRRLFVSCPLAFLAPYRLRETPNSRLWRCRFVLVRVE
jgi:hypothetical protein